MNEEIKNNELKDEDLEQVAGGGQSRNFLYFCIYKTDTNHIYGNRNQRT